MSKFDLSLFLPFMILSGKNFGLLISAQEFIEIEA